MTCRILKTKVVAPTFVCSDPALAWQTLSQARKIVKLEGISREFVVVSALLAVDKSLEPDYRSHDVAELAASIATNHPYAVVGKQLPTTPAMWDSNKHSMKRMWTMPRLLGTGIDL